MESTLVVGPSWVGDMVMTQPLLRLLRTREPDRHIDLLAPAWSLPVIDRMPEVRNGIVLPVSHGELAFVKRRRLGHSLRATGYGHAIVLPRSLKAALVPWFAGIPRRTGFRGEMRFGLINDMRADDRARTVPTVRRFATLGLAAGEALPELLPPRLRIDAGNQERLLASLELDPDRPAVALMPGAEYGPAKCWPAGHFARLAARLDAAGRQVWILGSARDSETGAAIAAEGRAINLCGRTGLVDALDLLARCTHAVSNDSGLLHMAAAAGTHVVGLYGSTSPDRTPPLTAHRTLHYLALPCSPCFRRECPLGHLRCLTDIHPDDVMRTIVAN